MRMRLDPADDLLHPLEEASNFNESRYYNFFDATAGLGGWVRMGNRPNEGYAELTVCLYLPDGRVAVEVAQVVRALDGALLREATVRHVYTFRDGLVARMDVDA